MDTNDKLATYTKLLKTDTSKAAKFKIDSAKDTDFIYIITIVEKGAETIDRLSHERGIAPRPIVDTIIHLLEQILCARKTGRSNGDREFRVTDTIS